VVIVPPHSSHTSPCGFSAAAVASVSSHLTAAPVTIPDGNARQDARPGVAVAEGVAELFWRLDENHVCLRRYSVASSARSSVARSTQSSSPGAWRDAALASAEYWGAVSV
jgi:hypothetical protein